MFVKTIIAVILTIAAASLTHHLAECDRLSDSIAGIERRTTTLVGDARARIARVEAMAGAQDRPAATREDQLLAAFAPPPSGHRDWLTVELPGL